MYKPKSVSLTFGLYRLVGENFSQLLFFIKIESSSRSTIAIALPFKLLIDLKLSFIKAIFSNKVSFVHCPKSDKNKLSF